MDCYRCLIQWGYYVESQNPTDYRYWSIPFTSHYITMATKTYYEPKEEAVPWLVGIDMQKFICGYGANFIGSSYVSCVGIGCQPQWGFKEHNNTHQSTVKLPIAFKKGGYVGAANDSGTVTIGIKPTDKQTIELRDNNGGGKTGIYWFVVGQ